MRYRKENGVWLPTTPVGATKAEVNEIKADLNNLSTNVNDNWQGKGYNLIPFPYYSGASRSNNGITYACDNDGVISVTSTTTATANSSYQILATSKPLKLKAGKYRIITNCNRAESTTTFDIWLGVRKDDASAYEQSIQVVGSAEFTITESQAQNCHLGLNINVIKGNSASGVTFRPMIVEVADDGSYPTEYQRYAKGNVELTDDKQDKTDSSLITSAKTVTGAINELSDSIDSNVKIKWTSFTMNPNEGTSVSELLSQSGLGNYTNVHGMLTIRGQHSTSSGSHSLVIFRRVNDYFYCDTVHEGNADVSPTVAYNGTVTMKNPSGATSGNYVYQAFFMIHA